MSDILGDKLRTRHILDAIAQIEKYIEDIDFDQFETNAMLQDACIRQLSIRGCLDFVFDAEKARLFAQIDTFFKPKNRI